MSLALDTEFDAAALLTRLGVTPGRITADSRDVHRGDVFAAYPGAFADGRAFIGDAIDRGAGAVLWEPGEFRWHPGWRVADAPVPRLRERLSEIAAAIYNHPSRSMWTVGVTGTNGKTSCTHWIGQCLAGCGRRAAVMGTLGNGLVGALIPARHTTADAAALQETLAQLKAAGVDAVAMEVSSHGLDQGRVNAVAFDVALFTNLTHDHLDYHGTMEAYGAAKAKLFRWPELSSSVINVDDPFGTMLAAEAKQHRRNCLTYGFRTQAAAIRARAVVAGAQGMRCLVDTPAGRGELAAPVVGSFNLANLLGCLGVLLASGVALPEALSALSRVRAPPGRMQRFGGGEAPLVVVDYAHSPDALQEVLAALRPAVAPRGRLVCVFGCGGDRDPGKRPAMGEIAARRADRVVVTSDNPRSEDPAAIAKAIVAGIEAARGAAWTVELDRGAAIAVAVAEAQVGDVVVIAGKGHETTQEACGKRVRFSDAEAATAALAAWRPR